MNQARTKLSPVLYLPHGGGPLPLLGDPMHANLTKFLKELPKRLGGFSSILLISAHWEEDQATVTGAPGPELIYDYYGFPEESYEIQYKAAGNPALAEEVVSLLISHGLTGRSDASRGYDHGLFVPLKLMYPDAEFPCIQLSLLKSLDPAQHIQLGKAISSLRKKGVLVIGSGMSFHNMQVFRNMGADANSGAAKFNDWLIETCTAENLTAEQRESRLVEWEKAPFARYCHPREEHLLPLHVCFGAASQDNSQAQLIYEEHLMGAGVCGLLWS